MSTGLGFTKSHSLEKANKSLNDFIKSSKPESKEEIKGSHETNCIPKPAVVTIRDGTTNEILATFTPTITPVSSLDKSPTSSPVATQILKSTI